MRMLKFDDICRNFANAFRKWKMEWRFARFVANFANNNDFFLQLPEPIELFIIQFIIQFIYSIHFFNSLLTKTSLNKTFAHAYLMAIAGRGSSTGVAQYTRDRVNSGKEMMPSPSWSNFAHLFERLPLPRGRCGRGSSFRLPTNQSLFAFHFAKFLEFWICLNFLRSPLTSGKYLANHLKLETGKPRAPAPSPSPQPPAQPSVPPPLPRNP